MRLLHYAVVAVLLFASATIAQTPDFAQRQAASTSDPAEQQEEETVLAEGEGRSEVFGYCTA